MSILVYGYYGYGTVQCILVVLPVPVKNNAKNSKHPNFSLARSSQTSSFSFFNPLSFIPCILQQRTEIKPAATANHLISIIHFPQERKIVIFFPTPTTIQYVGSQLAAVRFWVAYLSKWSSLWPQRSTKLTVFTLNDLKNTPIIE